jgi:hypothetical protein
VRSVRQPPAAVGASLVMEHRSTDRSRRQRIMASKSNRPPMARAAQSRRCQPRLRCRCAALLYSASPTSRAIRGSGWTTTPCLHRHCWRSIFPVLMCRMWCLPYLFSWRPRRCSLFIYVAVQCHCCLLCVVVPPCHWSEWLRREGGVFEVIWCCNIQIQRKCLS